MTSQLLALQLSASSLSGTSIRESGNVETGEYSHANDTLNAETVRDRQERVFRAEGQDGCAQPVEVPVSTADCFERPPRGCSVGRGADTLRLGSYSALRTDSLSSGFRLIGPFQNLPQFSDVFRCPTGSYMNPRRKCAVW